MNDDPKSLGNYLLIPNCSRVVIPVKNGDRDEKND